MTGKIIYGKEREFTALDNTLVRGWNITVLNEDTGETRRYFVSNENLKGFSPDLIGTIKGKTVEISSDIKNFNGKDKVVLDKIVVLE